MIIKAFFDISHPYFVTSSFTLVVIDRCSNNQIMAPVMKDQIYVVGTPQLVIQIPEWSLSMPDCGPI